MIVRQTQTNKISTYGFELLLEDNSSVLDAIRVGLRSNKREGGPRGFRMKVHVNVIREVSDWHKSIGSLFFTQQEQQTAQNAKQADETNASGKDRAEPYRKNRVLWH